MNRHLAVALPLFAALLAGCPEDECRQVRASVTWDGAEQLHVVMTMVDIGAGLFGCADLDKAACIDKIKGSTDHLDLKSNGGANVVERLERGDKGLDLVIEVDVPLRGQIADHLGISPATTQVGQKKPTPVVSIKVPDNGTVTSGPKDTRVTVYAQSATTGLILLGKGSRKVAITTDNATPPDGILSTYPGFDQDLVAAGLLKK